MKHLLSQIPAINKILMTEEVKQLLEEYPEVFVKDIVKKETENIKSEILNNNLSEVPSMEEIIEKINLSVKKNYKYSLRRVINATGTILHTNLGRSILSDIIKRLTGAEDVLVVNNNAAAVMLTLSTLAKDKEIVVSRGELVEIGGAFRIPEIIKLSGGTIQEVGTTNKTHLKDYVNAINENTGILLKVHTSNYKIVGFTKEVTYKEISDLAHEKGLVAVNDLGSGQFVDFTSYGLTYEPTVKEVLDSGIDVVTFSGDKLLGGPQAGIIVGKKKYIEAMKKNQLTRALRVDKMTIAALEATFRIYLDEEKALKEIPTLNMISMSMGELREKADKFAEKVKETDFSAEITEDKAEIGGGSYPGVYLDSMSVKLTHNTKTATEIEGILLEAEIPIITRIKENSIIFDMRTLREQEFDLVVESLKKI